MAEPLAEELSYDDSLMVEELVFEKTHNKPYHVEGRDNTEWILIDFVDVVVHVFLESARGYYKLEELWADAERIVKEAEE